MPPKTYFEELSYALRRRELLPRPLEEDGLIFHYATYKRI